MKYARSAVITATQAVPVPVATDSGGCCPTAVVAGPLEPPCSPGPFGPPCGTITGPLAGPLTGPPRVPPEAPPRVPLPGPPTGPLTGPLTGPPDVVPPVPGTDRTDPDGGSSRKSPEPEVTESSGSASAGRLICDGRDRCDSYRWYGGMPGAVGCGGTTVAAWVRKL